MLIEKAFCGCRLYIVLIVGLVLMVISSSDLFWSVDAWLERSLILLTTRSRNISTLHSGSMYNTKVPLSLKQQLSSISEFVVDNADISKFEKFYEGYLQCSRSSLLIHRPGGGLGNKLNAATCSFVQAFLQGRAYILDYPLFEKFYSISHLQPEYILKCASRNVFEFSKKNTTKEMYTTSMRGASGFLRTHVMEKVFNIIVDQQSQCTSAAAAMWMEEFDRCQTKVFKSGNKTCETDWTCALFERILFKRKQYLKHSAKDKLFTYFRRLLLSWILHRPSKRFSEHINEVKSCLHITGGIESNTSIFQERSLNVGVRVRTCVDCIQTMTSDMIKSDFYCYTASLNRLQKRFRIPPQKTTIYLASGVPEYRVYSYCSQRIFASALHSIPRKLN